VYLLPCRKMPPNFWIGIVVLKSLQARSSGHFYEYSVT